MSAQNESRQELQERKDGLEASAMMMAVQGLAIPEEISAELSDVQAKLAQFDDEPAPPKPWTAWLGHVIEGHILQERLSSGSFSHTFRAVHEKTGAECAIKLARTEASVKIPASDYLAKQALSFQMEICQQLNLSANTALRLEAQRLKSDTSAAFVKILSTGDTENCFYYRMPLLSGQSLKELIKLPDTPLFQLLPDIFERAATLIDRLNSINQYHGNLQPDNLFVTKTDLLFLSPGCFDVYVPEYPGTKALISTPAYYPFFDNNDIFALGTIFWESVCKQHPLPMHSTEERTRLFSAELRQMLEYRRSLSHAPLWHFLSLQLPREIRNDLSDESERLLLKALKLSFDSSGYLTGAPGFSKAADLAQELRQLCARGLSR